MKICSSEDMRSGWVWFTHFLGTESNLLHDRPSTHPSNPPKLPKIRQLKYRNFHGISECIQMQQRTDCVQQNHAISLSVGNSEFDDGYIEWLENQFLVIKSTKEYIRYYIFSWKFGSFENYEMPPFRLTFANNFSTYGKLVLQEVTELILFSIRGPSEDSNCFQFSFSKRRTDRKTENNVRYH